MQNHSEDDMILAAKCAPEEKILSDINKAGITAVELYLSNSYLKNVLQVVGLCKKYPLSYIVHAPNDGYCLDELSEIAKKIEAGVVVFHNIYWENEWAGIVELFKNVDTKLCIENTYSIHEPSKFTRRYGLGGCLDLEHVQKESAGVFEEEFIPLMKKASHIHLTGYTYGSQLWHTHIHHSPEHNSYMLGLLRKAGYAGFIVSEARVSLQTYDEFRGLAKFYKQWKEAFLKISA